MVYFIEAVELDAVKIGFSGTAEFQKLNFWRRVAAELGYRQPNNLPQGASA